MTASPSVSSRCLLFLPPTETHQTIIIIIIIFNGMFSPKYDVSDGWSHPRWRPREELWWIGGSDIDGCLISFDIILCTYLCQLLLCAFYRYNVRLFILLLCTLLIILTGNRPEKPLGSYCIIIIFSIIVSSSDYYGLLLTLVILSDSEFGFHGTKLIIYSYDLAIYCVMSF